MAFTPIPAPLYQRIFAVLSQRISQGDYAPGSRLATEDELRDEFGVSKATIRRAVDELVARGHVVRRQGSGTFVREETGPATPAGFVGTMADLILGTPQLELLDVRVDRDVPFPPAVRAALGSDEPTGTVYRTRRLLGDVPFVYAVHYVSPQVAELIDRADPASEGLLSLLHRENIELTGATQTLSAQLADVDVAEALNIELGAAVLFVRRILNSPQGTIDCLHTWYRGDLYQWTSDLSLELSDAGLRVIPESDVTSVD